MEHIRRLYLRSWRGLALSLSLALIAYLLYFQRLGSLLPGYSQPELNAYTIASNWHTIASHPINAPYKVFVWLFTAVLHHGILVTRTVAAAYGLVAGLLFFLAVRAWCTYRAAFLATVMFVTSAGLLHFARLGTGNILQMSLLALIDLALWYRAQPKRRPLISYCIVALAALLWYVPGMVWFEILGVVALHGTVRNQVRHMKTPHLAGLATVFLVVLAPLIRACIGSPKLLLQVAGLPHSFITPIHLAGNLWNTTLAIVARSNGNPLLWPGHAPLLNAAEVVICLLGAYYIYRQAPLRRIFFFGAVAIGLILVALGGNVTFAVLTPMLYLFIATGLDHLLGEWLTVFPRNPVARISGIGVICVVLIFSVLYQLRAYYVAWPNTPATRQTFDHPAP